MKKFKEFINEISIDKSDNISSIMHKISISNRSSTKKPISARAAVSKDLVSKDKDVQHSALNSKHLDAKHLTNILTYDKRDYNVSAAYHRIRGKALDHPLINKKHLHQVLHDPSHAKKVLDHELADDSHFAKAVEHHKTHTEYAKAAANERQKPLRDHAVHYRRYARTYWNHPKVKDYVKRNKIEKFK